MPQDRTTLSADGWARVGVTLCGIIAAGLLGWKQMEIQAMVAQWQRDDQGNRANGRAEKLRHTAAQVHECAADAFAFAEQAHFEAMRSNYRSARSLSIESMERMRDAHAAAWPAAAVAALRT